MNKNEMIAYSTALTFIESANANDIKYLINAIKKRQEVLSNINKRTFEPGQTVKFSARGINYTGKIISIKVKNAVVAVKELNNANYNVALKILQAA